ncbi:type I-E CRISPR-associated protein Cse2/CasB, partial [Streptomyces noursei]
LDEIDMHEPISYVLEGDDDTKAIEYVPLRQREDVIVAAHHTLALYACHMQSKSRTMHRRGISLGTAARDLQLKMRSKDGASQRFRAALSADSTTELSTHLRFLISLFRTYDIAPDYVALADALAHWEQLERRRGVVRRWGMDFRRTPPKTTDDGSNATDSPKE